ncbi:hypothetical protein BN1723_019575, partial [Verticillium longisporum]
CQRIR